MIPVEPFLSLAAEPQRLAPEREKLPWNKALFCDLLSSVTTVAIALFLLWSVPQLVTWAFVDGVWSGDGEACRSGGACWAFLREKYRLLLFGIYPPEEQWRPVVLIGIVFALTLATLSPRNWTARTGWAWLAGIFSGLALMRGGFFGLEEVPTTAWGGLPITLIVTIVSLAAGFPLAVLLALGRRSGMPFVRLFCTGYIELIRALPLLSLLFIAALMLPLMLPDGVTIDKLVRAIAAMTIASSAYLAEIVRGGLQGVGPGQEEAARALGFSWRAAMRQVVLPQAIRNVIPPLTNTVVVVIKNSSLVLVVGLFDLMSAGRAALADPEWPAPFAETYLFIAGIYFLLCFGISQYSRWIERQMTKEVRR
ncbi:amino-acid transporter subunit; membrane component of ABC superfamily [uncultured Sphingopyxis sp.]|uniref:Amino-acid transporter subunit membrane component of ABC superfamily n=1 Tax=uncultured Sphingopyxis sp. TaxID=310581 RepID=A0A1Y5PP33_9SPHN|nr:amino acid ABC transporter permease [uncultured Sphingopyxis sp.]SBV31822.1 amino-acid transporter subunit; membrane component of ABC superfamily [uncultured Sphingopyxis sp.]